jgi:hypothetical protein
MCREQIEKKTTYFDCCNEKIVEPVLTGGGLSSASLTSSTSFSKKSNGLEDDEENCQDMRKLQQQLHDIKEHVIIVFKFWCEVKKKQLLNDFFF